MMLFIEYVKQIKKKILKKHKYKVYIYEKYRYTVAQY